MPDLSPWYMQYGLAELKGDPAALARSERRAERFRLAKAARKQKAKASLKEGLEKFDIGELEAWQDTEGYDQITSDLEGLREVFVALKMRGVNIEQPRNKEESMLSKKMSDALKQVQKDTDLYNLNKKLYSDVVETVKAQGKLEEHERTIDIEATEKKLLAMLDAPSISEMNKLLSGVVVVSKAKPVDLQENYSTMLDQVMIGQKSWKGKVIDPVTGKVDVKSVAGTSAESLRAANKKLIKTMPERVLKQYKADYEADLYKEGKSFEEWMMRYSPVSLKKVTIEEEERKGVGTEPVKDEEGNILWTTPAKTYGSSLYGRNVAYQSVATIGLGNIFTKPVKLPVLSSTRNIETDGPEIFQMTDQDTTPLRVNFYAVADKEIRVPVYMAPEWAGIIPEGEKMPMEVMEYIRKASTAARKPLYNYHYEPFIDMVIDFTRPEEWIRKKFEDIKAFERSSIVPYREMRKFLKGIKGFDLYDEAIMNKYRELLNRVGSIESEKVKF